jgi:hypothetical protein
MADVLQQLRGLAEAWETEAPAVRLDEVVARTTSIGDHQDRRAAQTHVHEAPPSDGSPRRQWFVGLVAAAAVIGLIVGLVALAGQRPEPAPPGLTTIVSEPQTSTSVAPTTSTSFTTTNELVTTTAPSVAPTTRPPIIGNTSAALASVQRAVASSLSSFDSFSATIVMHQENLDGEGTLTSSTDSTNRVVMLADGRIWSEGSPIEWQSFDPQTGVAQMTSHPEGSTVYLRYKDFATIPIVAALGLDPLPRFATMAADTTVDDIEIEGRPAWSLTSSQNGPDGTPVTETFVIDKTTGLVVRYSNARTSNGVSSNAQATMTDVHLGAALPAEFPGHFPAGANIQESGSDVFTVLDLGQATAQFGEGFLAPAGRDPARAFVAHNVVQTTGSTAIVVPTIVATLEYHTGFSSSTVKLTRTSLPVGGGYCRSSDGRTCAGANGSSVVTTGAMAGEPSEVSNGVLTVNSGTLTVEITAVSDEEAVALANSLATVQP